MLQLRRGKRDNFPYYSFKMYVVAHHKNCHNMHYSREIGKIIFELSSILPLTWSSGYLLVIAFSLRIPLSNLNSVGLDQFPSPAGSGP